MDVGLVIGIVGIIIAISVLGLGIQNKIDIDKRFEKKSKEIDKRVAEIEEHWDALTKRKAPEIQASISRFSPPDDIGPITVANLPL